jgi:Carbon-nitrogen hydrolase
LAFATWPAAAPRCAARRTVPDYATIVYMRPDDPALGPPSIIVACVNFEAVPRDKGATLEKMATFVAEAHAQGCDLIIVPELELNTWGPCADCAAQHRPCAWHRGQAEAAGGPACRAVVGLAAAYGVHVVYGFEEASDSDATAIFNSRTSSHRTGSSARTGSCTSASRSKRIASRAAMKFRCSTRRSARSGSRSVTTSIKARSSA